VLLLDGGVDGELADDAVGEPLLLARPVRPLEPPEELLDRPVVGLEDADRVGGPVVVACHGPNLRTLPQRRNASTRPGPAARGGRASPLAGPIAEGHLDGEPAPRSDPLGGGDDLPLLDEAEQGTAGPRSPGFTRSPSQRRASPCPAAPSRRDAPLWVIAVEVGARADV